MRCFKTTATFSKLLLAVTNAIATTIRPTAATVIVAIIRVATTKLATTATIIAIGVKHFRSSKLFQQFLDSMFG